MNHFQQGSLLGFGTEAILVALRDDQRRDGECDPVGSHGPANGF